MLFAALCCRLLALSGPNLSTVISVFPVAIGGKADITFFFANVGI